MQKPKEKIAKIVFLVILILIFWFSLNWLMSILTSEKMAFELMWKGASI